jgi:hypothetical protein
VRSQLPAPGWLAAHVRAAGIALRQRRCFICNCRARRCFLKVGPAGAGAERAARRALPLYTPCMCSRLFPLHHHAMPQMPAHCPLPARPLPRARPPTGAPRRWAGDARGGARSHCWHWQLAAARCIPHTSALKNNLNTE